MSSTEANGALAAGAPVVLAPPAPTVLAAVQRSWDDLRKRARVLVILDVSGSMGENVEKAGQSRLELAKSAAAKAVQGFAGNDQLGLWVFSTQLDGNKPYVERVPVGPASSTVPRITGEIADLVPDGGTGLYATLRAAQIGDARRPRRPTRSTRSCSSPTAATSTRPTPTWTAWWSSSAARASTPRCACSRSATAPRPTRTRCVRIAEASSAAYYDASDPATIDKVLTSVLSNF